MPKDYTYAEVSDHNSPGDALLVIEGKVYDISTFAEDHPGGEPIILDQAGSDATEAFRDVGHSDDARAILRTLLVGILRRTAGDSAGGAATVQKTKPASTKSSSLLGGPAIGLIVLAVIGILLARKYLA